MPRSHHATMSYTIWPQPALQRHILPLSPCSLNSTWPPCWSSTVPNTISSRGFCTCFPLYLEYLPPLLGSYSNVIWSWMSSLPILSISTCVRAHTYPLTLIYLSYHHPTYSHLFIATCYLKWGSMNPWCLLEIQSIRPYPRLGWIRQNLHANRIVK